MKQVTAVPPFGRANGTGAHQSEDRRPVVSRSRAKQFSREEVFDYLSMVAQGIAKTLGSCCEAVVHDFADPEHSIVTVAGSVTGRKVGGAITDLGLSILQSGLPYGQHVLVYESLAPNGKRLKSTSVLFCDADGHPFGALCINLDTGAIEHAAEILTELVGITDRDKPIEEHFSDNPWNIIGTLLSEELEARRKSVDALKRKERIEIVRALRDKGVFNMRHAPSIVGELLGVSRFTVYNYLNDGRQRRAAATQLEP